MHIRRGEFDVAERGHLEEAFILRPTGERAEALVHIGILQPVVVDVRAGHEVVRAVTSGAGGAADLAEEDLPTQIFLRGEVREAARHTEVILGLRGDDGTDELGEGLGDALGGHLRRAEGLPEEIRVKRLGGETVREGRERHAHFQAVLNWHQGLLLERRGAFVPEEFLALIPTGVAQAHRVPPCQTAVEADAELARVREAVGLQVTGRAGDGLVRGEALVVEEHAAQRSPGVGSEIGRRRVVLSGDWRLEKARGQGRGGVVERRCRQEQRVRRRAQDGLAHGVIHGAEQELCRSPGRDAAREGAVVQLQRCDLGPVRELGGALENPDVVGWGGDLDGGDVGAGAGRDAESRHRCELRRCGSDGDNDCHCEGGEGGEFWPEAVHRAFHFTGRT